ncbi:hypothetical protein [Bacillus sp. CECT 9360]|uniref:hypothetical protein n=1 Tax=Bacillus sp. CECT 9360 TaxID=2845821 RepID=UPI001E31C1CE|nr:hypothetical protein [Bacillus sp. CECT 9360]CAH0346164.1 hypothetical protein BCI9360_02484 [Bacillus sp. CECT 9360]
MSLKAIELQVALPRTHDAGKIQEQWQQKDQLAHHHAANEVHKDDEKKRTAVIKQEQKEKLSLHKDGEGAGQEGNQRQPRKKKTMDARQKKYQHPYKGISIDYSG